MEAHARSSLDRRVPARPSAFASGSHLQSAGEKKTIEGYSSLSVMDCDEALGFERLEQGAASAELRDAAALLPVLVDRPQSHLKEPGVSTCRSGSLQPVCAGNGAATAQYGNEGRFSDLPVQGAQLPCMARMNLDTCCAA
jgi:hypothetical protein